MIAHRLPDPDPFRPDVRRRDFVFHKTPITGLELGVLDPGCLYEVTADTQIGKIRFLEGDVLSRNLELTARNGFNPEVEAEQNFIRFHNSYDAKRGLAMVGTQGERVELPALESTEDEVSELALMAINLRGPQADEFLTLLFESVAAGTAARLDGVRNPHKVAVRERLTDLKVSPKRRNALRLLRKLLEAERELIARKREQGEVSLSMDRRALIMATYHEKALGIAHRIERAVELTLGDKKIFGDQPVTAEIRKKADDMAAFVPQLRQVHIRPFGPWSYRHSADDLDGAAGDLREGNLPYAGTKLWRVRRSMGLVFLRRDAERTLTVLSRAVHTKTAICPEAWVQITSQLESVQSILRDESWEEGFRNKVLPHVREHLDKAIRASQSKKGSQKRLKGTYTALKKALKAI